MEDVTEKKYKQVRTYLIHNFTNVHLGGNLTFSKLLLL